MIELNYKPTLIIIDEDGENIAVRGFLLGLESNCYTFSKMRKHMEMYGQAFWPDEFATAEGHLNKFAQQYWLRYLFSLEK